MTYRAAVEALPAAVVAAHGAVDAMINNAGIIQPFVPVNELGYDALQRVLDVNLMGTVHMVKAFLPVLLERPEAHLANVSSMGGFFPFPGQTVYGASKAARIMVNGIEKQRLHIYVGPDARLMSLAIKVAPRPAIRLVQKQMAKRFSAPDAPVPDRAGG
jgi:NADP-dependent 3-hydroxy acid dehydrogenase YdfG